MRKRIARPKYLVQICYLLSFTFAFFLFLYLTLPVESLRQRIVHEIEERTPFDADIRSVSISPFLKINLHDINLYRVEKPFLDIADLQVDTSILHLFSDVLEIPFRAHLLGGETRGNLIYNSKTDKVLEAKAEVDGIDVKKVTSMIPSDRAGQNLSIQGIIDGRFSVKLGSVPQGDFDFRVSSLGISNVEIKNIVLPTFSNMESNFSGRIENGITHVEGLEFTGDDIDLKLSGTMPLLWEIHRGGKIDFKFRLKSAGDRLGLFRAFLAPQGNGPLGGKIVGTLSSPRVVLPAKDNL